MITINELPMIHDPKYSLEIPNPKQVSENMLWHCQQCKNSQNMMNLSWALPLYEAPSDYLFIGSLFRRNKCEGCTWWIFVYFSQSCMCDICELILMEVSWCNSNRSSDLSCHGNNGNTIVPTSSKKNTSFKVLSFMKCESTSRHTVPQSLCILHKMVPDHNSQKQSWDFCSKTAANNLILLSQLNKLCLFKGNLGVASCSDSNLYSIDIVHVE